MKLSTLKLGQKTCVEAQEKSALSTYDISLIKRFLKEFHELHLTVVAAGGIATTEMGRMNGLENEQIANELKQDLEKIVKSNAETIKLVGALNTKLNKDFGKL